MNTIDGEPIRKVCVYCTNLATDMVKIADAVKVSGELRKAPTYMDVCDAHKEQAERSVTERLKRSIRPREMVGQVTIEDYLL